jgi:hypothetical protein
MADFLHRMDPTFSAASKNAAERDHWTLPRAKDVAGDHMERMTVGIH